ncbi:unnamed protein product [Sphagnum troendelagicum]
MDVDVPKWRGEIIAGWKGDEDEVVNIDDEDGGLGEYGDSTGLHRQDASHTTENGGLELASILTFGNRKEDNVSLEPWNEGALFQAHHVVTSSELRSQSQCHSHGHCEAASTEKDNPSRNGTEVGGKRMCMEMEPSSPIQKKRERLSTLTPHIKILAAREEGIKKCSGSKCEVLDAKSDHLQQLGGENQQQRGSSKSWVARGNTSEELLVAATESGRQQLGHDDHVKDGTPSPRTPCRVVNKVLITERQLLNDVHEGGDFPGLGESKQDDDRGKKQMEFEHKNKQSHQNEQHQSGAEGGRNLEVQNKGDAAFENQVGMKRMRESRGRVQERNVREKTKFAKECYAAQHVHERLPVDIEILPQKRIVVYDTLKKELELSDGGALRIDPESLGKIFKKSSIGPMPRECIQELGTEKVRSRFPRRGRSSKGLDFTTLDQNCEFAKRLKDTWIREYDEESFVIMLRMRFVAACLMEESGSPVNWAADLSRELGGKIRDISSGKSLGLSAFDHRVLLKILESTQEEEGRKSSAAHGEAARERVESSGEESTMDWMEYNHLCQKCNFGGELLLCDGRGCRAVYHKDCLDPPLEAVPAGEWYCPQCEFKRKGGIIERIWAARKVGTAARYHGSKLELEGEWEYLVQWKSRSHAHNKWLPEAELIKLGPKELARFRKSLVQGQVDKWNPGWAQPERVIKRRQVTDGGICRVEWLVKWTGLGYEQCTWEPADAGILASPDMSKLFLAYEQLHNKPLLNLDKQPDWILSGHITLTQLDALNQLREWWHNRMNGILVDEGSQEKMVTTILFILSLVEDFRVVRPTLIVVHVGLLSSWEQELRLWAPKLNLVSYATKNEEARDVIRRVEFNLPGGPFKPDIVLTTFEVLNADMEVLEKVDWEVLIVDEARRPRPQKAFRAFCQLSSVFRLLLLSESLKMNVEELSQCIAFLEPEKSDVMYGQEGALIAELQQQLRGRLREYTPTTPLAEYWVPVELTHVHLRQYCDILVKNFPALSRNRRDQCSTQIQTVVAKLRQSCNHPFLADATLEAQIGPGLTPREILEAHIQMSGKMRLLHLILPILQSAGWRVVIFAQETKQLNILDKYMLQLFGADSFEQVDSDMAVNHKQLATQRFNSDSSKQFVFLLKSGIHISLRNVQLVIIYDSDWNPENDTRALKKVHFEGIGGKKPLAVFRLYTELSVEENILALSHDKKIPVISSNSMVSAKVCHRVLMRGVKEIFDLYDHAETTTHLRPQREGPLGGFKGNNLQDLSSRCELQRVWYDAERARKLVYGVLNPEICDGWSVRDELLGSIFSSREDMVPVFTESHVVLDTRKSVEGFWTSLLKQRHEEWQAQEVNNLGKGHRERRKVAYSEEALASAAYTKAQVTEEREGRLQRLQQTGGSDNGDPDWSSGESPENQDTEFFNSAQPCTDEPHEVMDANDLDREEEDHSCLNDGSSSHDKELSVSTSGGSTPAVLPTTDTAGTSPKTTVTDVGVSLIGRQQEGSTTATAKCIQLIDAMMTTLMRLCQALKLPETVANHARDLVMHVSKMSSLLKDKRSHYEIVALDLALCWVAAHDLHHPLNKRETIKSAEAEMGIKYKYVDQLEETLYQKLKGMCGNYHAPASQPSAPVQVELVVPSLQEGSPVVTSSVHPEMLLCNSKDAAASETTVKELSSSPSVGSEASPCLQPKAPSGGSELQAQEPGLSVPNIGSGASQSLQPKTQSGGSSFPSKLQAQQSLASMQLLRSPGAVAETTQTSQPQTGSAQCAKDATSDTSFEQSYQLQQPDEPQLLPNLGFAASAGLQQPQAWSGVPSQVQVQEVVLPSSSPLQTTPFLLPESQQQMFSTELLLSERPKEQISGMWPRAQTVEMQHMRALVKGQTKETERLAQRTEKEKEVMRRKLEVASASVMKHADPGPILEQLQKFSDFDVRVLNLRLAEERNLMEFRHGMELGKLKELHAVQRGRKDNRSAVPSADVFALESEVKTICEYYSQLLASSQDTNTPSPLLSTTPVSLGMLSVQSATSSLVTLPHAVIEQNERQQQMQQQSSCPPTLLGASGDKPSGGLSSSSLPSGQYEKAYQCLESRIALSLPIPVSRGPTPVSAAAGQNASAHLVSESTRIAAPAPISIPRAPTLVSASSVQYESSHLVSESTRVAVTEASVPISRGLTSASVANNTHYENARPVLEAGIAVPIPVPVSSGRSSASTATGQSESAHQVLEPGISASTHVHELSTLIPSSIAMVGAASASSHPSSAILVREQEKLSSVANKLKGLFQEETKRIKAQYDKEAEQLHRRYEALLTEEHHLFSEKQKMLQHDIAKMDLCLQSMHGSSTTPSQGVTYTVAPMPQQARSVAACASASAAKMRSLAQQQPAAGTLPVFQTTGSSSRVQFVGRTSGLATTTTNSRTPPCVAGATASSHPAPEANTPPSSMENLPSCHAGVAVITRPSKNMLQVGVTHVPTVAVMMSSRLREQTHHMPDNSSTQLAGGLNSSSERGGNSLVGTEMHPAMPASLIYLSDSEDEQ